jgi:hypothetical protein
MASHRRVLIYGGKGALGSACVKFFKSKDWVCLTIYWFTLSQSKFIEKMENFLKLVKLLYQC